MGVITRIFLAYGACTVGRQEAGTGERETIEDYVRFQSFFAFKIKDGDCRKILKILDNSFMSPRDWALGQNSCFHRRLYTGKNNGFPFLDILGYPWAPVGILFKYPKISKNGNPLFFLVLHQPSSGYCYLRSSKNSNLSLTRKICLSTTG